MLIGKLNSYGRKKRLWITEYGYQTQPPTGISASGTHRRRSTCIGRFAIARKTRRIDMIVWFLIPDERRLSGWQSGVVSVRGRRKPAFRAFQTLRR